MRFALYIALFVGCQSQTVPEDATDAQALECRDGIIIQRCPKPHEVRELGTSCKTIDNACSGVAKNAGHEVRECLTRVRQGDDQACDERREQCAVLCAQLQTQAG